MATTAAAVSRVLYNAGITKSKTSMGRICYMASEGYEAKTAWDGSIVVDYRARTAGFESPERWIPRRDANRAKIKAVLEAKGYTVVEAEYGFVVTK